MKKKPSKRSKSRKQNRSRSRSSANARTAPAKPSYPPPDSSPEAKACARIIRKMILEMYPDAVSVRYPGEDLVVMVSGGATIARVGAFKSYCSIHLNRGAELDDPDDILRGKALKTRRILLFDRHRIKKAAIKRVLRAHHRLCKKKGDCYTELWEEHGL